MKTRSPFATICFVLLLFTSVASYQGMTRRRLSSIHNSNLVRQTRLHASPTSPSSSQIGSTASDWEVETKIGEPGSKPSFTQQTENQPLRNLRSAGSTALREDPILQSWNEFKGLSERDLLTGEISGTRKQEKALSLAYRRCEYVTQLFSKTFHMGTTLMEPVARQHVWAIYAWCRRTDDIVDSRRALLNRETLRQDLAEWGQRLDATWAGQPADLFDLALADTVRQYPTLSKVPFQDMIKGMVMDVPGLGQERYGTFEELYLYCYRVAGTVGIMTLPILGVNAAEGYTEEQARAPAEALGIALQLTNILRDVGEDLERGRIYLPLEDLAAFDITENELFSCKVTPKYIKLMQYQIRRARMYYSQAAEGLKMLAPSGRFAVQASLDLYGRILDIIERNGYDNFNKRAFTTKLEKLTILPSSYYKSQFLKS